MGNFRSSNLQVLQNFGLNLGLKNYSNMFETCNLHTYSNEFSSFQYQNCCCKLYGLSTRGITKGQVTYSTEIGFLRIYLSSFIPCRDLRVWTLIFLFLYAQMSELTRKAFGCTALQKLCL